ncbi:MAG: tautomerase family protein [Anaerolineae bacterium]|jgi:4-oxalocrotonate tautomerase family enzyme|nr:hypothetical protein [Chloroflexota bacterium]
MPIVQVQVWQGFGEDRARRLIEGITASFEEVGVPSGAVQVVIQEVPRAYWGVGGQVSGDRDRDAGARGGYRAAPQERPAVRREGAPARDEVRPPRRPRGAYGQDERASAARSWDGQRDEGERPATPARQQGRPGRAGGRPGLRGDVRRQRTERRPAGDTRPGRRPRRGGDSSAR